MTHTLYFLGKISIWQYSNTNPTLAGRSAIVCIFMHSSYENINLSLNSTSLSYCTVVMIQIITKTYSPGSLPVLPITYTRHFSASKCRHFPYFLFLFNAHQCHDVCLLFSYSCDVILSGLWSCAHFPLEWLY